MRTRRMKLPSPYPMQDSGVETIIDASNLVLGRMCTSIATRLLAGERVHVVNAENAIVTGPNTDAIKSRYLWKAEVGTRRKGPFFDRQPHLIVKRTVRGMLPYQKPAGRAAFKRLRCHIGTPPELVGKTTITVEHANRPQATYLTVGQISKYIGGSWLEVKTPGTAPAAAPTGKAPKARKEAKPPSRLEEPAGSSAAPKAPKGGKA